jgi:hypothetical protein
VVQVMATLKKASAVRRGLALGLLGAAVAYVRARRVVEGVDLRYAVEVSISCAILASLLLP